MSISTGKMRARIEARAQELQQGGDVLDLQNDVARMRAMWEVFLDGHGDEVSPVTLAQATELLGETGKLCERIERIRASQAYTAREHNAVVDELCIALAMVRDADNRREILEYLKRSATLTGVGEPLTTHAARELTRSVARIRDDETRLAVASYLMRYGVGLALAAEAPALMATHVGDGGVH